jgi:type IV pilus assembly protein PilA
MNIKINKILKKSLAFTLLELLVVMVIISIIASISIPQFSEYRRRAFDTRALSDLRNVATAEEVYFMDKETYLNCTDQECTALPGIVSLSKGVKLKVQATNEFFVASSHHKQGTGKVFSWDSEKGGLIE